MLERNLGQVATNLYSGTKGESQRGWMMLVENKQAVPGWLSQLSFRLLVLTGVMISGCWDGAPMGLQAHQESAPDSRPPCLPLPLPLPPLALTHEISLSEIDK